MKSFFNDPKFYYEIKEIDLYHNQLHIANLPRLARRIVGKIWCDWSSSPTVTTEPLVLFYTGDLNKISSNRYELEYGYAFYSGNLGQTFYPRTGRIDLTEEEVFLYKIDGSL